MADFVYVLTNPFMPGLVKIGITSDLETRLKSLHTTGVPVAFECHFAGEIENARLVENRFHKAFDDKRVNPSREFFKIEPEKVIGLLELLVKKETTPKKDIVEDQNEQIALDNARKQKSRIDIFSLGLKIGDELSFLKDSSIKAIVINHNTINYANEPQSLSSAALKILNSMGYQWRAVSGPNYWTINGKSLATLRDELEDHEGIR